MCRWQHYPIKFDPSIRSLADNPQFRAKALRIAREMVLQNPIRTRRFKWNSSWMQIRLTNQMELFVFAESKLMQTGLLDGENSL